MRAAKDWAEARRLALKRLFGVDEHTEDALIEQLARVLTDEEIDTAIAAFRVGSGPRDSDAEAAACARRDAAQGETRTPRSKPCS